MKGSTLMWYSAYNPEGTLIMHIMRASAPFCAGAWMRLVSKSLTPCKTRQETRKVSPPQGSALILMTHSQTEAGRAELRIWHQVSARDQIAYSPTTFSPNQTETLQALLKKKQTKTKLLHSSAIVLKSLHTHLKDKCFYFCCFSIVHLTPQ